MLYLIFNAFFLGAGVTTISSRSKRCFRRRRVFATRSSTSASRIVRTALLVREATDSREEGIGLKRVSFVKGPRGSWGNCCNPFWRSIKKAKHCLASKLVSFDSASTSVVKGKKISYLSGLQIACRHLAGLAILFKIISKLLAFSQRIHTCAFNCRDMDECIAAAIFRLNKSKAFCRIKPFNCTGVHWNPFQSNINTRVQNERIDETIF